MSYHTVQYISQLAPGKGHDIYMRGRPAGRIEPNAGPLLGRISLDIPGGSQHYLPLPGGGVAVVSSVLVHATTAAAKRAASEPVDPWFIADDIDTGDYFLEVGFGDPSDGTGPAATLRRWERLRAVLDGPQYAVPVDVARAYAAGRPVPLPPSMPLVRPGDMGW